MNWALRLYTKDEIAEIVNDKENVNEVLSLIKYAKGRYVDLHRIISENPNEFNKIKSNMELLYEISRLKAEGLGADVSEIPSSLKIEDFLKEEKSK